MARPLRLIEAGLAFHVTARGNYRQTVFFSDHDRAEYLDLLQRYAGVEGLEILGWCAMTNHVHLLVVPQRRESLSRCLQRVQSEYSRRLNQRHGPRTGHLWQSRFYSCPLEGQAVWTVLRYIECNPVRAGLVPEAWESGWSSAAVHCSFQPAPAFLSAREWAALWSAQRWQSVLAHGQDERQIAAIQEASRRGLPFGSDQFVKQMGHRAGRNLIARSVGRPRVRSASGTAAGMLP